MTSPKPERAKTAETEKRERMFLVCIKPPGAKCSQSGLQQYTLNISIRGAAMFVAGGDGRTGSCQVSILCRENFK